MLNCFRGGNVDGRRDDVIAGLAEIDVIVGMHELTAPSPAQQFGGTVRNHFIGVHVRRSARTGLEHIDRELIVKFPSTTSVAACLIASAGCCASNPSEWFTAAAARLMRPMALITDRGIRRGTDGKVFDRARRLHSIIGVCRDGQLPHRVALDSRAGRRLVLGRCFHAGCSMREGLSSCGRHDKLRPPASTRVSAMDGRTSRRGLSRI